jgi:hypothetical protein
MNRISRTFVAAALALGVVVVPAAASAQGRTVGDLRRSMDRIVRDSGGVAAVQTLAPAHRSTPQRQRSVTRKIIGGVVGAAAGFFGGLYLGAALEPDCKCDDPGLKGALIGAPIGAVVGGIVGATWF